MGSAFELMVGHPDQSQAEELLEDGVEEVRRIEGLLTEFREDSVTGRINRSAGSHSVRVPEEVYQLIRRCVNISSLTQGAFDISVKPLKKLYDFKNRTLQLPTAELLGEALLKTGYSHILPGKNNSFYFSRKGMEISFASIGKGYAADRVRQLWKAKGVISGVINAGGDLSVIGHRPDGTPWKIGIADPDDPARTLLYIPLSSGSVATSGDYEQYFERDGMRFSHTLDPRTGKPVSGIKSVTVTGISSELCDALATAVTVMGVEVGLHFIDQLPDTHCLIIDGQNNLHFSKNIIFEKGT